jgi:metal-responsive CopG/Arc/MetJ family transcriptional regulator
MKKKPEQETRITVRFPASLVEQVRLLAQENGRSLNSELVQAVKYYVDHEQRQEKR